MVSQKRGGVQQRQYLTEVLGVGVGHGRDKVQSVTETPRAGGEMTRQILKQGSVRMQPRTHSCLTPTECFTSHPSGLRFSDL